MLSGRKIKRKIRSVQNIKKITRAMEMVSAAKFKRVWTKLTAIRPYSSKLKSMTENLLANLKDIGFKHPFIYSERSESMKQTGNEASPAVTAKKGKMCVIAVSSSKGLCGGYNANMTKALANFITSIETTKTIEIVPIGKKIQDFARKRDIKMRDIKAPGDINIGLAKEIITPIINDYENGLLSEVWLVYSEFVNPMINRPKVQRFLPFVTETDNPPRSTLNAPRSTEDYLFEPEPTELLNLIIPRYLEVVFYRMLLEAYSSEHSARMIAMRNASKNASEVIDELTLTFNKARQANITRELLDIVGGAEGMK
ncbi:MAG: ATP synthase F1 subunit gamma [Planctomycetes bacterium]|nr:ATP synthase F1 subunit gamma [Planctomycetota bacterium]